MTLETFPIPQTGRVTITPCAGGFEVRCQDFGSSDYERLMGFFNRMMGRFGTFRFEGFGRTHERCRFDSDSASFASDHRTDTHSVVLPISVERQG